ncbi:immunoglobulin-like domain-containing protein [Listeria booriae]|uniref:Bacterial Ig domain-containing protein n=1 Tax=Listeria booriae TaxID=1552123 RepID=A0A842F765_9LIST|nr:immunoglobulin-like domain-containing protein [Listeria booriae]MBC2240569.1 hypothetical protein [Listeria booriae]
MIFKTQITKKVLATSATLALLGGSIVTPLNVLSVEAAEAIQTATTTGSELISRDLSLENNRFKNFTITGEYTNLPNVAFGFELTGTDPNWYGLSGQTHRMVRKSNPFAYYLPETRAISETAGFTAVTIDTKIGKSYVFDYSYSLSNSNAKTASASSKLNMEAGVSQYGGDKIKYNTYSLAGNQETTLSDKAQIEFKATSVKTIVYMRVGYTFMNTSGAQHFASLDSYSLKAVEDPAELKAEQAIADLFVNGNVNGTIKDSTNQAALNDAKNLVAAITDTTKKAEFEAQLAEAQKQVDTKTELARQASAKRLIEALFNNNDVNGTIKDSTNPGSLANPKSLVAAMTDTDKKAEFEAQIAEAQRQIDARKTEATADVARQEAAKKAVEGLFTNNDVNGTIKDSTNQAALNDAKNLVATITDTAKKAEFEAQIAEAQKQVDVKTAEAAAEQARQEAAKKAVEGLFNNNNVNGTIKDSTNQTALNTAKNLVAAITDTAKKAELEAQLAEVQKQLDAKTADAAVEQARQEAAKKAVEGLFNNNNVNGTIKDSTNQAALNDAKNLVAAITDTTKKAELEAQLAEAQKQVDTKTELARQASAKRLIEALFNNNDVNGTIKDSTNLGSLANPKSLVAAMTDTVKKAEFEAQIAEAQRQIDARKAEATAELARQEAAKKAVEGLFTNNDVNGTIKDSTNQAALNDAKNLVAAITDTAKKAGFEAQLAEAQKQVDVKTAEAAELARQEAAEKAVKELFNSNDVTGTIKDNTNQAALNTAKNLVATITDTAKKAELEKAITEAQKQLADKETKVEVTGKVNPFILHQDRYLSGTYTGDITAISVDVNGKRYYGGTVNGGEFSFYALDKIANPGDVVIINLYSADKVIQKSITVQIKEATKVTQAAYNVKDSNITGTFNNPDITKMNIVVNGTTYWGGTLTNGTFKFYALDKIKSATDEVTMNFYNAKNELIISKNLTITAPVVTSGEITSATVTVGDKNIVGTFTGDIKSISVTIDGTTYNGGTIAADGTFKFYVADKRITADSVITIVGYDKAKTVLSEVTVAVSK